MDSKDVLRRLLRIADNQQKIITKLAQTIPNAQLSNQTPPQHLAPPAPEARRHTHMQADKAIFVKLPQGFWTANIAGLNVRGNDVNVQFKPGKLTQANIDAVTKAVQAASNDMTLPGGPYAVKGT